jgi:hypothetical protein
MGYVDAPPTIHDLLMALMVDRLESKLRLDVVNADLFTLNTIKIGRLQDDPTTGQSNLLIHPGNKDWRDIIDLGGGGGILSSEDGPYEIGSRAAFWRRRFTLDMEFFINTSDRAEAIRTAMSLSQRVHVALMTIPQSAFPRDEYGEQAHMIQVFDSYLDYGGGEGTYIWRGEKRIEWLTELDPDETALD